MKTSRKPSSAFLQRVIAILAILVSACGPSEIKPVDIYPEDNCSNCRMAISERSFASELITEQREVFKFDDLGCLGSFRRKHADLRAQAVFVTEYDTKQWLRFEKSVIVKTGIETPMGSGKIACSDSSKAQRYVREFPPERDTRNNSGEVLQGS